MSPRFLAPDLNIAAAEVTLPAGESAHLTRVLRLREGDAVEVFDGRGALHAGVVRTASPRASIVTVGAARTAAPEPPAPIIVAQALLKGDAMDAVLRDATVLGASTIWPMTTSRTNVPARAARRGARALAAGGRRGGQAVRACSDPAHRAASAPLPRCWSTRRVRVHAVVAHRAGGIGGDSADVPVPATSPLPGDRPRRRMDH